MLSTLHQLKETLWKGILKKTGGFALGVLLLSSILPHEAMARTAGAKSPDLLGKTIVLDAGHGGHDAGASGHFGVEEKDVTLAVAQKLALLLRQNGAKVVMTRIDDDDLATDEDRLQRRRQRADLTNRLKVVREARPSMFLSIHCNSTFSPLWSGAQALYMKGNENGKQLAKSMQGSFRENLLPTDRDPAAVSSLFLLKHVRVPSSLVEIGFLSNPQEERKLGTSAYQQRVAFALYTGILSYMQQEQQGWMVHFRQIFRSF